MWNRTSMAHTLLRPRLGAGAFGLRPAWPTSCPSTCSDRTTVPSPQAATLLPNLAATNGGRVCTGGCARPARSPATSYSPPPPGELTSVELRQRQAAVRRALRPATLPKTNIFHVRDAKGDKIWQSLPPGPSSPSPEASFKDEEVASVL